MDEFYEMYGRCIVCCKDRPQNPSARWLWHCGRCSDVTRPYHLPIPWEEWKANG